MAFEILRHLQYGSGSDCGQNLNRHPSRIIPITFLEEERPFGLYSDSEVISFIPPRLGEDRIICDLQTLLPEPAAYFRGQNSFLKAYLYLSSLEFYQYCHLPKKADDIMQKYLRDICEKHPEKNKGKVKKLIQSIMNNGRDIFDTDPRNNPYFSVFYDLLFPNDSAQIIIVKSSEEGNYRKTIPAKLPSLTLDKTETGKICYILLSLPNHTFAPYGRAYLAKRVPTETQKA